MPTCKRILPKLAIWVLLDTRPCGNPAGNTYDDELISPVNDPVNEPVYEVAMTLPVTFNVLPLNVKLDSPLTVFALPVAVRM